jgi:hypothetical protein
MLENGPWSGQKLTIAGAFWGLRQAASEAPGDCDSQEQKGRNSAPWRSLRAARAVRSGGWPLRQRVYTVLARPCPSPGSERSPLVVFQLARAIVVDRHRKQRELGTCYGVAIAQGRPERPNPAAKPSLVGLSNSQPPRVFRRNLPKISGDGLWSAAENSVGQAADLRISGQDHLPGSGNE